MKRVLTLLWHGIEGCVGALLIVSTTLFAAGKLGYIQPFGAYVILSGSMAPALPVGSVILTQKQNTYASGDIITFKKSGENIAVSHRIAGVTDEGFTTKGDANKTADTGTVSRESVTGKTLFTIPYLGYIVNFAKSPKGFLALIVVPATIIIYEELKNVKNEFLRNLKTMMERRRKKKEEKFMKLDKYWTSAAVGMTLSKDSSSVKIPMIAIFSVVVTVGLMFTATTGSFFSDSEQALGNFLGAAASYTDSPPTPTPSLSASETPTPTPTPISNIAQTLVINEVLPDTSCSVGNKEAQWLEVYNGFNTTVNLKDYSISDGINEIDLVTAVTNLPSGQFALIAHDNATWTQCYAANNAITANFGGGTFNIDTGTLQLKDPSNIVIDTVQWAGATGLNPAPNQSIERDPDGVDTAPGASFNAADFVIRNTPAPGL